MAEDVFGIVGSVIAGAYQVEAVVAEGGFGVVYRAHHVGFRAPIALKCLKVPQQLGPQQEAEFLEQFRAEAELLFRLSASIPTVVRPLHVDALKAPDGRFVPFMALEWLEGKTLERLMEERVEEGRPPLSLKKLVRLLNPVARALERAHNFQGPEGPISIVHRDLKPENIFLATVAGEEIVKVLDFGIAKAKSVASQAVGRASQTQSSLTAFTPAYGAPEQWLPKRYGQTGPWTDVWGLALTLVELLAQRSIIDGDPAAMMGAAIDPERRPTPRTEGIEVSEAVERVFARALAVDPRDRQRDAGEFWSDLLSALGMRGDEDLRHTAPPRDSRAEPGLVPRVETIETVKRPSEPGSMRPRLSSSPGAETLPAPIELSESPSEFPLPMRTHDPIPMPMPALDPIPMPMPPFDPIPALDAIPDLAAPAQTSVKPSARASAGYARDLDLDLTSNEGALDLRLDVGDDVQLARRVSRPDLEPSQPPASGPSPVSPRPVSGRHPIVERPTSQPAAALSARPSAPASLPVVGTLAPIQQPSPTPLVKRLLPGLVLLALSIVITLADQVFAAVTGEVFSLGPLRTSWIAGLSLIAGIAIVIQRLIQQQNG